MVAQEHRHRNALDAVIRRLAEGRRVVQPAPDEQAHDDIELIRRILERGYASGAFRRPVEAIDLHVMISAFCVFRIAHRHTFGALFDHDLTAPELRETYRRMLGDMVIGYLAGAPAD